MYDTREDATQKVVNSTVLFDGLPVWVTSASGGKNKVLLEYCPLPWPEDRKKQEDSKRTESVDNPKWDFKGLPSRLGYVNINKSPFDNKQEAVFVSRVPTRHTRQGLDDSTVKVTQCLLHDAPWTWGRVVAVKGFLDAVTKKFPTAEEAVKLLIANPFDVKSIAISKKLALVYDRVNPPNLIYRNEKVGFTEDGILFRLAPHKSFLKEEFTDMDYLKIA